MTQTVVGGYKLMKAGGQGQWFAIHPNGKVIGIAKWEYALKMCLFDFWKSGRLKEMEDLIEELFIWQGTEPDDVEADSRFFDKVDEFASRHMRSARKKPSQAPRMEEDANGESVR